MVHDQVFVICAIATIILAVLYMIPRPRSRGRILQHGGADPISIWNVGGHRADRPAIASQRHWRRETRRFASVRLWVLIILGLVIVLPTGTGGGVLVVTPPGVIGRGPARPRPASLPFSFPRPPGYTYTRIRCGEGR